MKIINTIEFEETIKSGLTLVDFYADWCGPCQMMMPVMEEIGKSHTVYKVNTDDQDELAFSYGVMSIPCIISFKDGKEYKRHIGVGSKSDIEELLK